MIHPITFNQLIDELKTLAKAHGMVNDFFFGDTLRAWKEETLNYPLVNCFVNTTRLMDKQNEYQITLVVSDRIYQDWNYNLNEVHSDTLKILRDLVRVIRKSKRWQKMGRIESDPVANSFVSDTGDYVAGWSANIVFNCREESDTCELPIFDYDFENSCNMTGL